MPEARPTSTTSPDLFLARRAAGADPRAWDEIIDRYGERIFNLAYRFTGNQAEAEELTQDIFLQLYRNLERYRGEVPLIAWALRLSRNLCIDHYRHHRARRQAESVSDEVLRHLPSAEDVEQRSQQRERRRLVGEVLAEMSESLASVVMLRDLQVLTYDEIATAGETRGTEAWEATTAQLGQGIDNGWRRISRLTASCERLLARAFTVIATTTDELITGHDRPLQGEDKGRPGNDPL